MKRIIALLLITIFIGVGFVYAEEVTLGWEMQGGEFVDGYKLFQRADGSEYDYLNPIYSGTALQHKVVFAVPSNFTIPAATNLTASFNKESGEITLSWNQNTATPVINNYYYVVRAFLGNLESANSNEVSYSAVFEDIVRWYIYYSENANGPWTEFVSLPFVSSGNSQITEPFTAVPVGTKKTIYFTLVTFGEGNVYSPNSAAVAVEIDRIEEIPPPFLYKVVIPVG